MTREEAVERIKQYYHEVENTDCQAKQYKRGEPVPKPIRRHDYQTGWDWKEFDDGSYIAAGVSCGPLLTRLVGERLGVFRDEWSQDVIGHVFERTDDDSPYYFEGVVRDMTLI